MADTTLTPLQGRVLFHSERLFRSVGGVGIKAHGRFILLCAAEGIPTDVPAQTPEQSVRCLALIEQACRDFNMHYFRDVDTSWRGLPTFVDYFDREVKHNQYFPTESDYHEHLNHQKEQHA